MAAVPPRSVCQGCYTLPCVHISTNLAFVCLQLCWVFVPSQTHTLFACGDRAWPSLHQQKLYKTSITVAPSPQYYTIVACEWRTTNGCTGGVDTSSSSCSLLKEACLLYQISNKHKADHILHRKLRPSGVKEQGQRLHHDFSGNTRFHATLLLKQWLLKGAESLLVEGVCVSGAQWHRARRRLIKCSGDGFNSSENSFDYKYRCDSSKTDSPDLKAQLNINAISLLRTPGCTVAISSIIVFTLIWIFYW